MTPGFHVVPSGAYHADPCAAPSLSSSVAQILLRESPRKAWFSHPKLNPTYKEDHDAKFDMGTCAHAVLLENDASRIAVVDADDWRTKAAKEQRDAARAAGKTPLLARHYEAVRKMVDVALAFIEGSEIAEFWHAKDAGSEVTGVCQEKGVWLRCRFDRFAPSASFIGDYKSTTDASPEGFSRQIVRMGYHVQEAFYRRVARILSIHKPKFIFLAQSVEEPFECSLHGCDSALQEIADAEVQRAIDLWRECLQKNEWPSYGGRIHWTVPSTWQMRDYEQRLMEAAA
jgi:hypothetical protein